MVRVLVAEDSSTARDLLVRILGAHPELEVVGEARNGREAVDLTHQLKPDVVTMDIQMPELDGLLATQRIMTELPTPIVIVSGYDVKAMDFSLRALRAGALAVLPKPPGPLSPGFAAASRDLTFTVQAMSRVRLSKGWGGPRRKSPTPPPAGLQLEPKGALDFIAIGASTGGPAAIHQVLSELPASFRVPLLLVQHIAPGFTEGLASWLGTAGPLCVKVAVNGELLRAGTVYLAPDRKHLTLTRNGKVALTNAFSPTGICPSVDRLLNSLADEVGPRAGAVILTGMGRDGLEGASALFSKGGRVAAQDEESSIIFGMPKEVIQAGVVHRVVALKNVARLLVDWSLDDLNPRL